MSTTSATEPAAWVPGAPPHPPVTYADETRVAAFVAAHKLDDWVGAAIRLARDAFPDAKRVTLSMVGAPDDEEYGERLILDIAPGVGADQRERQYRDYVRRWIDATPPWVTDRMGIALTLS